MINFLKTFPATAWRWFRQIQFGQYVAVVMFVMAAILVERIDTPAAIKVNQLLGIRTNTYCLITVFCAALLFINPNGRGAPAFSAPIAVYLAAEIGLMIDGRASLMDGWIYCCFYFLLLVSWFTRAPMPIIEAPIPAPPSSSTSTLTVTATATANPDQASKGN